MDLRDIDTLRIASPEDVRPAAEALYRLSRGLFDCRVAACHNIAVKQLIIAAGILLVSIGSLSAWSPRAST